MKILITGGLGHIGSYLIHNIHKIKNIKKVYVIDNFSTNKLNSLAKIKKFKNINVLNGDLRTTSTLKKIPKVDLIIHLASIADAEGSIKMGQKLISHNLTIFKKIISYCLRNKSKLIHISSTSVYGQQSGVLNEKSDTLPQSPYAKEKLMEEKILEKNSKKIKFATLRFGTISGFSYGMRFQTAVNKFCLHSILGLPITVWKGSIDHKRAYLSLNDSFKTIAFFINQDKFTNEIYNVLTGNFTVKQIIQIIKKYKKEITIKTINSKIKNQLSYIVSNKKIKLLGLNYSKNNLSKSIKEILENFNSIKNYEV